MGKIVDMYCEDHDTVGCYVCVAIDHKWVEVFKLYFDGVNVYVLDLVELKTKLDMIGSTFSLSTI